MFGQAVGAARGDVGCTGQGQACARLFCLQCGRAMPEIAQQYADLRRFCSPRCRYAWHREAEARRLRDELASLQASLPFGGRAPQARQCSHDSAQAARVTRGAKTRRYLDWLREHGPAIDHEAAAALGWPLSTICSVRNGALNHGQRIVPAGKALSPYGHDATRWEVER